MLQQLSNHTTKGSHKKSLTDLNKDPEWQFLRKKLLNMWMCKPDWCCLKIRKFLNSVSGAQNNKLKIVSSYLSSSGFRSGAINYPCVVKLKSEVFAEIKNRKSKGNWS